MLKINEPIDLGRSLAGLSLVTAPVLLLAGEVVRLTIEDGAAIGTEQHLANVAASAGPWQLMTVLNMISVILFVPAVLGLIHLLRRTRPILAHVGGGLALVGLLGAAGHNVFAFVLDGAMSQVEGGRAQMAELVVQLERLPSFGFVLVMFIAGFVLGLLLLGIGVYRGHVLPRWIGAAIGLGMLVSSNAGGSLPLTLVADGLLIAGMATIGLRVLAMSNADWQRHYPSTVEAGAVAVESRTQPA